VEKIKTGIKMNANNLLTPCPTYLNDTSEITINKNIEKNKNILK